MACNHTNINCGCKDSFLTTPAPCPTPVGCPDPQPCSEVFDAQCIVYTGDPIICDQDTVVATNDTVADALNQVVDYFCDNSGGGTVIVDGGDNVTVTEDTIGNVTTYTINATCCPTFVVDIEYTEARETIGLNTVLTNGTGPYTYSWTYAQNYFLGLVFSGPVNTANVDFISNLTLQAYEPTVGSGPSAVKSTLVKVTVTDSNGQIATAYYKVIKLEVD